MTSPVSPFVLHIPHSTRVIPDDLRPTFLLSEAELRGELIATTDSHTDALFGCDQFGRSIVFPFSRLVVDPERYLADDREPLGRPRYGRDLHDHVDRTPSSGNPPGRRQTGAPRSLLSGAVIAPLPLRTSPP